MSLETFSQGSITQKSSFWIKQYSKLDNKDLRILLKFLQDKQERIPTDLRGIQINIIKLILRQSKQG